MTIRERDRQPCPAMPAIPRHDRHPPTSQRMPRVGDFHFCWKPVGVVLQCVTDFKHDAGAARARQPAGSNSRRPVTPCPKLWRPYHESVIFGCVKAETIAAGGARPGRKPDEDRQFSAARVGGHETSALRRPTGVRGPSVSTIGSTTAHRQARNARNDPAREKETATILLELDERVIAERVIRIYASLVSRRDRTGHRDVAT